MVGNVITANFRGTRTTTTSPLWQYDYGQVLRFTGVSLPETFEVHFSNAKEFGQAKTSIGNAEGVLIPDEFLVTGKPVFAWIFLHAGEDDGETVYMAQIPVIKRSAPSDEAPTPQEQSAITQAIAALNSAVVDVQEAVDAADSARASATSAASSATAAAASEAGVEADADRASNAATAAESAQTAAEAAQAGAETAQTGAESARDEAAAASTAQIAQINATGAAVLESIPADYTELSEDVSNLKSALESAISKSYPNGIKEGAGFKPVAFVEGQYYSTPDVGETSVLTAHGNWYSAKTKVSEGDTVVAYSAASANNVRAVAFLDENNTVLYRVSTTSTVKRFELTAPSGAAYAVFNCVYSVYTNNDCYAIVGYEVSEAIEQTENLWRGGDVICEGPVKFYDGDRPYLTAGTYTISAQIERGDEALCRVQFFTGNLSDKLAEPAILSGDRRSVTFTLNDDCRCIRFYSGLSELQTDRTVWCDIQIEAGGAATRYVEPGTTAIDKIARSELSAVFSLKNLWMWGDQIASPIKTISDNVDIAPGVYTLSANVSGDYPFGSSMRVEFRIDNTVVVTVLLSRGNRAAVLVDLSDASSNINTIALYAANVASNATGHKTIFTDVQLEQGDFCTTYEPPIDGDGHFMQHDDKLYTLTNVTLNEGAHNLRCMTSHMDSRNIVIDCIAKWDGDEASDYAVPEIRMDYSNLSYPSNWYNIGGKGAWAEHTWRMPPVPESRLSTRNTIGFYIKVPNGLTLTIQRLTVRYDDTINRPFSGLRIDGHGSFLFYPQHSIFAMRALAKCGASHIITIPKRSSDGVWFAYHDDTFDESSTFLRNADGTAIIGSQYNGSPFREIPWSWLKNLDAGCYMDNHFGGTTQFAGAHLMLISDMLSLCNATGVHPVFSCHPTYTPDETNDLRDMLKRYNLLGKTTLLPETSWFNNVAYNIFGNDIEMYKMGLTMDDTSAENLASLISLLDSIQGLDKSKVCIALWVNVATDEMVNTIVTAGYRAGLHAYTHTTKSGQIGVTSFSAGDLLYWQSKGVTVFTDNHNPSFGLNW